MEYDRPTNYEEEMVGLSPRNGYESFMIRNKSIYDYQVLTWEIFLMASRMLIVYGVL